MMSSLWGKKSALGVRGQNFKHSWAVRENRPYQNKILKFLRTPGAAKVFEKCISGVDANEAKAGVFEVKNHINRQSEGEDKKGNVEPTPACTDGIKD